MMYRNKKLLKKYSLARLKPILASQWHPTKNGDLTPEDVTPGSKKTCGGNVIRVMYG